MKSYPLLLSTVEIAKIHEERLRHALERLKSVLPVTNLKTLSQDDFAYLDVMAMRYAKLQDLMGRKIFPLLIDVMAEPLESDRFLDILAHLEKLGIVESVESWIDLRNARNFIAHEYPGDPDLLIQNIHALHTYALKLLTVWDRLHQEIDKISVRRSSFDSLGV